MLGTLTGQCRCSSLLYHAGLWEAAPQLAGGKYGTSRGRDFPRRSQAQKASVGMSTKFDSQLKDLKTMAVQPLCVFLTYSIT